jgi:hypothetical protein
MVVSCFFFFSLGKAILFWLLPRHQVVRLRVQKKKKTSNQEQREFRWLNEKRWPLPMKIRLSTNCIHPLAFHQEMRHPRFDQGASVGGVTSLSWLNSLDLREHPSHAILYKGVFLFKWLDRTILFYVVWIYRYTVAGNQYETLKESKPDTIDDDTHFL